MFRNSLRYGEISLCFRDSNIRYIRNRGGRKHSSLISDRLYLPSSWCVPLDKKWFQEVPLNTKIWLPLFIINGPIVLFFYGKPSQIFVFQYSPWRNALVLLHLIECILSHAPLHYMFLLFIHSFNVRIVYCTRSQRQKTIQSRVPVPESSLWQVCSQ